MATTYELGGTALINNETWLVVRSVKSTTLFEDTTTKACWIEEEEYLELRNAQGQARFEILSSVKKPFEKITVPIAAVKPYFWKEGLTNA